MSYREKNRKPLFPRNRTTLLKGKSSKKQKDTSKSKSPGDKEGSKERKLDAIRHSLKNILPHRSRISRKPLCSINSDHYLTDESSSPMPRCLDFKASKSIVPQQTKNLSLRKRFEAREYGLKRKSHSKERRKRQADSSSEGSSTYSKLTSGSKPMKHSRTAQTVQTIQTFETQENQETYSPPRMVPKHMNAFKKKKSEGRKTFKSKVKKSKKSSNKGNQSTGKSSKKFKEFKAFSARRGSVDELRTSRPSTKGYRTKNIHEFKERKTAGLHPIFSTSGASFSTNKKNYFVPSRLTKSKFKASSNKLSSSAFFARSSLVRMSGHKSPSLNRTAHLPSLRQRHIEKEKGGKAHTGHSKRDKLGIQAKERERAEPTRKKSTEHKVEKAIPEQKALDSIMKKSNIYKKIMTSRSRLYKMTRQPRPVPMAVSFEDSKSIKSDQSDEKEQEPVKIVTKIRQSPEARLSPVIKRPLEKPPQHKYKMSDPGEPLQPTESYVASKFKLFAEESENRWKNFIGALQEMEGKTGQREFANKIHKYKQKALECLKAVHDVAHPDDVAKGEENSQPFEVNTHDNYGKTDHKTNNSEEEIEIIKVSVISPNSKKVPNDRNESEAGFMSGSFTKPLPQKQVSNMGKSYKRYITEVWPENAANSFTSGKQSKKSGQTSPSNRLWAAIGKHSLSLVDLQNSSKIHNSIDQRSKISNLSSQRKLVHKSNHTSNPTPNNCSQISLSSAHSQRSRPLQHSTPQETSIKPILSTLPHPSTLLPENKLSLSPAEKKYSGHSLSDSVGSNKPIKPCKVLETFEVNKKEKELLTSPTNLQENLFKKAEKSVEPVEIEGGHNRSSKSSSELIDIREYNNHISVNIDKPQVDLKNGFEVDINQSPSDKNNKDDSLNSIPKKKKSEDSQNNDHLSIQENPYPDTTQEEVSVSPSGPDLLPSNSIPQPFPSSDPLPTTSSPSQEEEAPSFHLSTPEDKADIITSFILENLIIESISEDHCLPKFVQTLGSVVRGLEESQVTFYLESLFSRLQKDPKEMAAILERLNTPIGQSDLQRLLTASSLLSEDDQEDLSGFNYEPILDIRIYVGLEEELRDTLYQSMQMDAVDMEKEHIFHKVLFDSLNENLDHRRLYGIMGKPPNFFLKYKEEPKITHDGMLELLNKSKNTVMEWSKTNAGFYLHKQPHLASPLCSDEADLLKEKIMNSLVDDYSQMVDIKWKGMTDEYLECLLVISEAVFEAILDNLVGDLLAIHKKKSPPTLAISAPSE